jgi:hypothetical protein
VVRYDAGSATVLDSVARTNATDDLYEFWVYGTNAYVRINGGATNTIAIGSNYTSGNVGMICDGLDAEANIALNRFGNALDATGSHGNAIRCNNYIAYPWNNPPGLGLSGCLTSGGDTVWDARYNVPDAHVVVPHDISSQSSTPAFGHYQEFDLGIAHEAYGLSNYDHSSYHATTHMDDFSFFGRLLPTDSWDEVLTHADVSSVGSFGWFPIMFPGGAVTYRYWRIECFSTLNASDWWQPYEIQLIGTVVP